MPKSDRILAFILCALVLTCAIAFLLLPKNTVSEDENRTLAAFPDLSASSLLDGSFMTGLQDYTTDHFPVRGFFVQLKVRADLLTGMRESGGVYLGRDGSLIDRADVHQNDARFLSRVTALAQKTPVTLMLVPTAVTLYPERLPSHAPNIDEAHLIENLYQEFDAASANTARVVDTLSKLREFSDTYPLFYRTDHHWTIYGAYMGYLAYCETMGIASLPLSDYTVTAASDDFRGSLYARFGDYSLPGETLWLAELPGQNLNVTYHDTGEVTHSLYNRDYLTKRDQHSAFLNNLHDLVTIENPGALSDRTLVVIKDSYANSMLPFLTAHYRTICVIDPRYYKSAPSELIAGLGEDVDTLVLYNVGTMDDDAGVGGIF